MSQPEETASSTELAVSQEGFIGEIKMFGEILLPEAGPYVMGAYLPSVPILPYSPSWEPCTEEMEDQLLHYLI